MEDEVQDGGESAGPSHHSGNLSIALDSRSQSPYSEPSPPWCKCGRCNEMPRAIENKCCKCKKCVTSQRRFQKICLDPEVLELCIKNRADTLEMTVTTIVQVHSGKQHTDNLFWTSMDVWGRVIVRCHHLVLYLQFEQFTHHQLVCTWVLKSTKKKLDVMIYICFKSALHFLNKFTCRRRRNCPNGALYFCWISIIQ